MPLQFERPIGVRRDIAEMEYIMALMQATDQHKLKEYLQPYDIVMYLKSRHGIDITEEQVEKLIFHELVGQIIIVNSCTSCACSPCVCTSRDNVMKSSATTKKNAKNIENEEGSNDNGPSKQQTTSVNDNINNNNNDNKCPSCDSSPCACNNPDEVKRSSIKDKITKIIRKKDGKINLFCIDICQLVSILLIPTLLEAVTTCDDDDDEKKINRYFDAFQRKIFLADDNQGGEIVSVDRLKQYFHSLGEKQISDELLQEMVDVVNKVTKSNLDVSSKSMVMAKVLTDDVRLFNLDWKRKDTTNFHDVTHQRFHNKESPSLLSQLQETIDTSNNAEVFSDEVAENVTENQTKTTTTSTSNNNNNNNDQNHNIINDDGNLIRIPTLGGMDYCADTYRRPLFVMMLWASGIAAYFAYVLEQEGDYLHLQQCNGPESLCEVATGIVAWIELFIQLVVLGLPFIVLSSLGNSVYVTNKLYSVAALCVGIVSIYMIIVFPYFESYANSFYDTSRNKDKTLEKYCEGDIECIEQCNLYPEDCDLNYNAARDFLGATPYIALILGCLLIGLQCVDILYVLVPKQWLRDKALLRRLFTPAGPRTEGAMKKAASYRMSQILDNAFSVCDSDNENNRKSLLPTTEMLYKKKKEVEIIGGIGWAWKRIFNGSIFVQEGVWLHGRLLVCNFSQLLVIGMIIFFTRYLYEMSEDFFYSSQEKEYQNYIAALEPKIYGNTTVEFDEMFEKVLNCTVEVLGINMTSSFSDLFEISAPQGFVSYLSYEYGSFADAASGPLIDCLGENEEVKKFLEETNEVLSYESDGLKDLVKDLDIPYQRYIGAAWLGLFAGLTAASYIAIVMIPSYITSMLKYRSGVFPSLHDRDFLRYRYAMDTVTVLLGSAFWGSFFTATAAFALAVAFLLLIGLAPVFVGAGLGFIIILTLRITVLMFLRCAFFNAFYRKKPAAANIMFIVLEVWNIGLTLGFVFVRAIKLIAISVMFIARIDTPFLAPGVGQIGPVELDGSSFSFRKDLLMHEAHRNMLIERFGLICLLKIRVGPLFASRAGSAWRLLYVMSVMPWLNKFRVRESTPKLTLEPNDSTTEEGPPKEYDDVDGTASDREEIMRVNERNRYLEERVLALERELNSLRSSRYEI